MQFDAFHIDVARSMNHQDLRGASGPASRSAGSKWDVCCVAAVFAAWGVVCAGCAEHPTDDRPDAARSSAATVSSTNGTPPVLGVEPWTFGAVSGRVIRTASYRVFTTIPGGVAIDRLPVFLEAALSRYRLYAAPLPAPELAMDVYVMANRPQWTRLSARMFEDQAEAFLRIPRGGFTINGRAVLYDIGTRDTLALAGHEGWHQFTQSTFAHPLPIWLEEGLATHFEGYRWGGAAGGTPEFVPWANLERFEELRACVRGGELMALEDLLAGSPQELIARNSPGALSYYAQAWALAHFLREGEGGRYAEGLSRLVRDAASGTAAASGADKSGTTVFAAYFNTDLAAAGRSFAEFARWIVRPGAKERIVAGESPV